jgi:hypothetical protein
MLTAYFDDSGTHAGANVTLLAGLFGNAHQWDHFNGLWKQALEAPLNGAKPPVRRFRMFDCFGSRHEFKGWTRSDADNFGHQLANVIFKCGLWGCATVVTTKRADTPETGDPRRASGGAEGGATRYSLYWMLDWARRQAPHDRDMAFVFDDRPERKEEYQTAFDLFAQRVRAASAPPLRLSLTFANAASVLPLQAADLAAWEVQQDELSFLHRERPAGKFERKLIARMAASERFQIQSATPETIGSMADALEQALQRTA